MRAYLKFVGGSIYGSGKARPVVALDSKKTYKWLFECKKGTIFFNEFSDFQVRGIVFCGQKKLTVQHMGKVYLVKARTLYFWIFCELVKQITNGEIKSEYDTYCFQLSRFFKLTNKKPLTEKSKSKRKDFHFLDNSVFYAIEVLNEIGKTFGKEPLTLDKIC